MTDSPEATARIAAAAIKKPLIIANIGERFHFYKRSQEPLNL